MSLEARVFKLEEFAADVRKFTQILTEMMRRHDERLDEHTEMMRRHDERLNEHEDMFREANHSIAALANAQIRTEDSLKKIIERLDRGDG